MRPRPAFAASLAAVTVSVLFLVPGASAHFAGGGASAPGQEPGGPDRAVTRERDIAAMGRLQPGPVAVETDDFWSWALLDLATGEVTGAPDLDATSTTASMIKVWLAADYLRLASEAEEPPSRQRLADISVMIRDSENDPATQLYDELDEAESIQRMIERCDLTDSAPSWRWSLTEMSARDAARLAACVADGRAAGPQWTDWLLNEMRQVRGVGDFGIRRAFPPEVAAQVAIKNGYFARPEDGMWHLNCLATGFGWALAVIQRYPEELGRQHGAAICRSVAGQLQRR